MDEGLAREFAKKYEEFGEWFSQMTELTLRIPDETEAKKIRRNLGEMSFALDDVIYRPLKSGYPHLFND